MRLAFGECRIDLDSRELIRDGHAVHLAPKAFDLLKLLLEARPRVLPKAELMERLWPDAFVVEANLAVLVGDLRAALGDEKGATALIKTHHGVGYSFSGVVHELTGRAQAPKGRWILRLGTRRVVLSPGANSVGRDPECDVFVNDPSVSRHHAQVIVSNFVAHVEDLGSKNGTWILDRRVTAKTRLSHGEIVIFGSVEAVFLVDENEDPSTQTM